MFIARRRQPVLPTGTAVDLHRRQLWCARSRRGASLIIVMVTISTSLVLTYSFMRTQITVARISLNSTRRDLALQAAQAGAAIALSTLQSPDWQGVDQQLTRVVHSDAAGTAGYVVEFQPPSNAAGNMAVDESVFDVVVHSTGTWQSAHNANEVVQRHVEVVARLLPRLEGRTIPPDHPGDSAAANDLAANPNDYDEIQGYALYARQAKPSLVLHPGGRIDGNVFLDEILRLYRNRDWSSTVRNDFLDSIGKSMQTANGRHPHPIAGRIDFHHTPSLNVKEDLKRIGLENSWTELGYHPDFPKFNFSDWQTYRLYEGGFEYQAVEVGSTLWNKTLRPTADNPLGVFYRNGAVTLDDNVIIQGTLVSTGTVSIRGTGVHLAGFNWRGADGGELVAGSESFSRLPAIVADHVVFGRSSRASIQGAVVVESTLAGAGGDFEYTSASPPQIATGTAKSWPIQQPYSTVELLEQRNFSNLNDRGDYAIWLTAGTTGGWYPIVGVDQSNLQLTVVGEVQHDSTQYRIRRSRRRFIDIDGPVAGKTHNINCPPAWAIPTSSNWDDWHAAWKAENEKLEKDGAEPVEFVNWLASSYELMLEPTFHLRNTTGIKYRWSPPLFRPYAGTGDQAEYSGYRWKVVSWRELP